jgi:hypothetical protein
MSAEIHALQKRSSLRTRESSARKETRFERLYRRLDERHERVRALYGIEHVLRRLPFHHTSEDAFVQIEPLLTKFDSSSLEQTLVAIGRFLLAREDGKSYYEELEAEVNDDFGDFSPMTSPELIGSVFFERVTGEIPQNDVSFEYREGCFQVHFHAEKDFNLFEKICFQIDCESQNGATMGHFVSQFTAKSPTGKTFVFPLILVNEHERISEERITRVHEEQHLAAKVSFLLSELSKSGISNKAEKLSPEDDQYIKDELLAFSREGISGKKLIYDHLPYYLEGFGLSDTKEEEAARSKDPTTLGPRALSLRERGRVKREIRRIANALANSRLMKLGSRGRAFLVTHLYDIPLRQFPVWIDLLDTYYKEREGGIRDFFHDLDRANLDPEERNHANQLKDNFRKRRPPYLDAVLGVDEHGELYDWWKKFPALIKTKAS